MKFLRIPSGGFQSTPSLQREKGRGIYIRGGRGADAHIPTPEGFCVLVPQPGQSNKGYAVDTYYGTGNKYFKSYDAQYVKKLMNKIQKNIETRCMLICKSSIIEYIN